MTIDLDTLAQFTGAETYYRHAIARAVVYTDGVQYLAREAGAYWLIDRLALQPANRDEPWQSWTLTRDAEGSGAMLVCTDGDGTEYRREHIPSTDFPLPEITLWMIDDTILLPSEY